MERRDFLKSVVIAVAGAAVPMAALELIDPREVLAANPNLKWAFLVDTTKCVGCGMCVKACKTENEIPFDANVSRTWVERYVLTKEGKLWIDCPKQARDGYTSPLLDENSAGMVAVKPEDIAKGFFVPKLCNQCDNPPCVQVCPVGATYKTPDGPVLVDRTWCIGCGYCVEACPYGARFFHPIVHTADKCTFCYHRLHRGLTTACVGACPFGARQIGNLRDPKDPVTQVVLSQRVGILKPEYGTNPQAFYIGLSKEVC